MGSVFACADRVLVWLGEESDNEGDGILDVLPDWLSFYPPHIDWHAANIEWDPPSSAFAFSSDGLTREALEWLTYQQTHLMHFLHFFSRRWWSRRWVVQEVVQAKEALLTCGQGGNKLDGYQRLPGHGSRHVLTMARQPCLNLQSTPRQSLCEPREQWHLPRQAIGPIRNQLPRSKPAQPVEDRVRDQ